MANGTTALPATIFLPIFVIIGMFGLHLPKSLFSLNLLKLTFLGLALLCVAAAWALPFRKHRTQREISRLSREGEKQYKPSLSLDGYNKILMEEMQLSVPRNYRPSHEYSDSKMLELPMSSQPYRQVSGSATPTSAFSEAFRRPMRVLSGLSRASGSTTVWERRVTDSESGRPIKDPRHWTAPPSWNVIAPPDRPELTSFSPLKQPSSVPASLRVPATGLDPRRVDPSSFPIPKSFLAGSAKSSRYSGQSTEMPLTVRSSLAGDSIFCRCDQLATIAENAPTGIGAGRLSLDSSYQGQLRECRVCFGVSREFPADGKNGTFGLSRESSLYVKKPRRARRPERRRNRTVVAGRLYQE